MAQVTVTRENGDIEKITLADTKETGKEYMNFKCSDGVTRYALLGKQTDENASHLWVQKEGGEKKYVIKSPVTKVEVPTGLLWNKSNIPTTHPQAPPRPDKVTIPNGVKVLLVNMFLKGTGTIIQKYVGVTPGKTYKMSAYNTYIVGRWTSVVSSDSGKVTYYRNEQSNERYEPRDFLLSSVAMRYSPQINEHAVDIEDY